jgi:hypothetical protein
MEIFGIFLSEKMKSNSVPPTPLLSSSDDNSWHSDKFLLVTFMTYSKSVFGDHHHGIEDFPFTSLILIG